jgi:hypothetical protein
MSSHSFEKTVKQLSKWFKVHKVNKAESFLGWQCVRHPDGYGIHHGEYIRAQLVKFSLTKVRKYATPGAVNQVLGLEEQEHAITPEFHTQFRERLGALQHCQRHTRPDINAPLNAVTRKTHKPNKTDMAALERVMGYLAGTADLEVIRMRRPTTKGVKQRLHIFADASLINVRPDWKASVGYIVYLGSNLLSFASKSTPQSPESSFLAETISLMNGFRVGLYLHDLLESLGTDVELPIRMYCDNQAAILNMYRGTAAELTRHTLARTRNLRRMVACGLVEILYIPTEHQLADILPRTCRQSSSCTCEV